jgi:hypothetical protein
MYTAFEALDERQLNALLEHLNLHRFNKYGPMSKLRQPSGSVSLRVRSFYDLLQHRAPLRQATPSLASDMAGS